MANEFQYDVFLSHSAKDKAVVRPLAERMRNDGLTVWFDEWILKPGDSILEKIEEGLEHSRVLVFCMSENAFGSDWARLEAGTFRFRDPLNKERRFISLKLDDSPIKGALAQFICINWQSVNREQEYEILLDICFPNETHPHGEINVAQTNLLTARFRLNNKAEDIVYAFSPDGSKALTGDRDNNMRLWDVKYGECLRTFVGHEEQVVSVAWSHDQCQVLSGSKDKTLRLWDVNSGRCIRVIGGHVGWVKACAWTHDQQRVLIGGGDKTMRLWDLKTGQCLRILKGHTNNVRSVAWSPDERLALSASDDKSLRLWDVESGRCLQTYYGHTDWVYAVAWSSDGRRALSGSKDKTLRVWDVESGRCLNVLEGHTDWVWGIAWNIDQRLALSCSRDRSIRLWNLENNRCWLVLKEHNNSVRTVAWCTDGRRALSGDSRGNICLWNFSEFISGSQEPHGAVLAIPPELDQVQYTNAKVLLVGDTSSGKTGLAHRLATGKWKPSDGSTVGAWSTQWQLADKSEITGLEREIWLWDFGGQADQRLVHQLFMDRAALVLLLFDADKEDVLNGLRDWQAAMRHCISIKTPQYLVAGRTDTGFKASRAKLQNFANENHFEYYETSAKEGHGCEELSIAIKNGIPWERMEKRTSPRIFKLIKDQILLLRDEGRVLHTFKELREELWQRLPKKPRFSEETLKTVIGLLDGPGIVKELDYGTYILLQPEWINAYAQAVIRTLRQEPSELGCLPLRSIAEGKLLFQTVGNEGEIEEMKRLPEAEERVILREMERQLEERGLCLRQGDKLVFPSYCGRDKPAAMEYPSVFVSYRVKGFLDDIYATLVVKLADSQSFKLNQLWRDAADFATLKGDHHMGIMLTREVAGVGNINVYFARGVTIQEQVIFANYIHGHLTGHSEQVQRLRHYVCPYCHTPKGNSETLMRKLLAKKAEATVECDICDKRFSLWDDLEKLFASDEVRKEVECLRASDAVRLDSRRKGKLLALEVGSRITSADQKCFEIPSSEDEGIDMELEFTDNEGKGTGQRLYLQLKSGNSHLEKRKNGDEVFTIKKQSWVDYWIKQPFPVMLVIGTFAEKDDGSVEKEKMEFAAVRWMEISSVLRCESQNGKRPVAQIVFRGERLDMTSVRRLRESVLRIN